MLFHLLCYTALKYTKCSITINHVSNFRMQYNFDTDTYKIKGLSHTQRVEALTCYELVRVISRRLSHELPRVMMKKFKSCHTLTS